MGVAWVRRARPEAQHVLHRKHGHGEDLKEEKDGSKLRRQIFHGLHDYCDDVQGNQNEEKQVGEPAGRIVRVRDLQEFVDSVLDAFHR